MTRSLRLASGTFAALFLALHLPFLPASLEDLDSINFALGVRHFDVGEHQPHPPGYPIFIAAAKGVRPLVSSEAAALSLVGVVAGALSVFVLFALFRRIDPRQPVRLPMMATVLAVTTPLYWFTAARPLSDMSGLAAALAVQVVTLSATTVSGLTVAAFLSGLAAGLRSQIVWLTVPLLLLGISRQPRAARLGVSGRALAAFAIGGLVWAIPLLWLTGGPAAYLRVLFRQGSEDLSGVAMVWTTPTVRQFAWALYEAFVAPWASIALAVVMLVAAAAGCARMGLRRSPALLTLAVAFGPYLIFDILFQETATTRYALPAVVPVAYLAASGLEFLPKRATVVATLALALVASAIGEVALLGYSREQAPAFRMLADMGAAGTTRAPVLAMHRKEEFDLRRPIQWVGGSLPAFRARIPSTAKHEWLEVVKYWNQGGRDPVWFVADPRRSDLALFDHPPLERSYRWPFSQLDLIAGVRPSEMDWYVIDRPGWYLGEGWAITPETAGVAREDGHGPGRAPVVGWIRREPRPTTIMIGGRNLSDAGPAATLRVALDGRAISELTVPPGFFLRMLSVPSGAFDGAGDYATITIASGAAGIRPAATAGDSSGSQRGNEGPNLAIEQFDAQPADRVVFGFGEGWHEQEYNPVTGRSWRWTSDHATLQVRSDMKPLVLTLFGETETFRTDSHVIIRAGNMVLGEKDVGRTFEWSVDVPPGLFQTGEASITIETNQTYVPAEKRFRSRDRRRLGLKIAVCRLSPPS